MSTLKDKTAKGLIWGALGNGILQMLNLVFGIFLGRLLSPDDYGMIGMLTIFSVIGVALTDSGFTQALARKKDVEYRDYNAVFWFSTFISLFFYIILFLCAPLFASFFHQPALVSLSRLVFFGFVISGTAVVPNAIFYRDLKVKPRMISQVVGVLVSGVTGILLAWMGMAYWGIAIQGVLYVAIYAIMMWCHTRWRPSLQIDLAPIREMFGYSSKLLVTTIFLQVNNNVLSVLLGRWFTRSDVGHYTQAAKWNNMGLSLISNMVNGVSMPVLASVDGERRLHIFRKMLRFAAFVSFPLMLGLGFVSRELIVITVTEKWLPAAMVLSILCVQGAIAPIASLYTNLIVSDGRSSLYMYGTILLGLLQVIMLCLTHHYGLTIMVEGYTVLSVLWIFYWHYWAWRIIGISLLSALKDLLPFVLITLFSLLVAYFATAPIESIYLRFIGKIICTAIVYFVVLRLAHAAILKESIDFLLKKNNHK